MSNESRWDDWANNAKKQIEKRREDSRLKNQTFVAEQDLKKAKSPIVWEQVRNNIQSMRNAFNTAMEAEIIASDSVRANEIKLRIVSNGRTATAIFNPDVYAIDLEGPSLRDSYSASIVNGEVAFRAHGPVTHQPHEIAKRFVDSLVSEVS